MSVSRLAAGVVALAIGAAVVTALAANPEVKSDLAAANSEANADPASPAAAKSDRLAIRPLKPAAAPAKAAAGPVTSPVRKSRGRTAASGARRPPARFTAVRDRADRSQKSGIRQQTRRPTCQPRLSFPHACDEDRDERACLRPGAIGGIRRGRPIRHLLAEVSSPAEHRAPGAGTRADVKEMIRVGGDTLFTAHPTAVAVSR